MVCVWWFWWIIILLFCFPQNQKKQNKPFPFVGCVLLFPLGFVLLAFYSAVLFSMVPEESEETAHGVSVLLVVVCSCLRILFCCSDSPHSEQSEETRSHTRGSFCCIGTSEAGLLFCWNGLFFCSVSYGSRTIRRNEPTPTGMVWWCWNR